MGTQENKDVVRQVEEAWDKNRLDELESDPHLAAVGLFELYDHPDVGTYKQMRPPVRFSKTPSNIRRHPPRLGQHTDEVLAEVAEGEEA